MSNRSVFAFLRWCQLYKLNWGQVANLAFSLGVTPDELIKDFEAMSKPPADWKKDVENLMR